MSANKPVSTLLASQSKLSKLDCLESKEDNEYMSFIPYGNAISSIKYAMVFTRSNIAEVIALNMVSMYMTNRGRYIGFSQTLRYLTYTSSTCIEYGKKPRRL